jgi:hypothetical protein
MRHGKGRQRVQDDAAATAAARGIERIVLEATRTLARSPTPVVSSPTGRFKPVRTAPRMHLVVVGSLETADARLGGSRRLSRDVRPERRCMLCWPSAGAGADERLFGVAGAQLWDPAMTGPARSGMTCANTDPPVGYSAGPLAVPGGVLAVAGPGRRRTRDEQT